MSNSINKNKKASYATFKIQIVLSQKRLVLEFGRIEQIEGTAGRNVSYRIIL